MGAAFFVNSRAAKTAEEAYNSLCEEACYQYGHDSYGGHIGVSHGFTMVPLDQKKFTKAALDRWIDYAQEEADKWGAVHCVELPRSKAKGYPRGYRMYVFAGWAPE